METKTRKKVVIIGSAYPLRGGGISTFNERLAKAYFDRGDDVIIYTFSLQYPSFFFPGTTQFSNEPPPENLKIEVKINSVNPFNWIKTGIEISRLKPDITIVRFWLPFMSPCLGSISRIIRWRNKCKVIAITDNVIPHESRVGDLTLVKYFINSVDGFIALSRSVLTEIDKFNHIKPRSYYPHPLYDNFGKSIPKEEAKQKLNLEPNLHYLLFFGFIRDYKGLDLLLEAINIDKVKRLNVKLLVAGEYYGNQEKYSRIIDELNLNDSVELRTSFIPNTEVYLYFCSCDVVVQPYRHASQSGVTQIAYHFDKPMIVTNVGGLSEMVPDGKVGYVVQPEPEAIGNAIFNFFIENKESEFIANVKAEKARFSWDGLLKVIDNLL